MDRKQKAVELYKKTFNCSQSVFTAYKQDNLDDEAALRLSTVFGAGVACTGKSLCGAVTGALMAISMKHGRDTVEGVDAKAETYGMARKFMEEFAAIHGSCVCEEIIGINIGTKENMEKARRERIFETKCLDAVRTAADILERTL